MDSEPLSVAAWIAGLAVLGHAADGAEIGGFVGKTEGALADHYAPLVGLAPETLEASARRAFVELVNESGAKPFGDTFDLIRFWGARRLAIASNSPRWRLDAVLVSAPLHTSITVSAEEVALAKPAPDVYLRALDLLETTPDRALVIEDTPTGIEAGLAAGCRVVAVDRGSFDRSMLAFADLVVDCLWPI